MISEVHITQFELLALQNFWYIPLALLAALAGILFYKKRKEIREQLKFPFTVDLPLLVITPLVMLTLLGITTLRPSIGKTTLTLPSEARSLFIAFDISRSMLADDIKPNRLVYAKRKLLDLINVIERSQEEIRVGLIVFAGSSASYCPLTGDLEVLRLYIRELSNDLITTPGSSLRSALERVRETAKASELTNYSVLTISDGEKSGDTPKSFEAPVFTFGVGTEKGSPIPLRGGELLKDSSGEIVVSRREASSLKEISNSSGGRYYELSLGVDPLEAFFERFLAVTTKDDGERKSTVTRYTEIGHLFVWFLLALLLLLYSFPVRAGVLGMVFVLFSLSPERLVANELVGSELSKGKKAYHLGEYDTALRELEALVKRDPENPELLHTLGSTLYRLNRFKEAAEVFKTLSESSKVGRDVFNGLYNGGNSLLMGKDPKGAIELYDKALQILPEDKKTLFNRELAKKMLEEEEKEEENEENEEQDREEEEENDNEEKEEENKEDTDKEEEEGEGEEEENEKKKESESENDEAPTPSPEGNGSEQEELTPEELSEEEVSAARRWIQSLPETPLLVPELDDKKEEPRSGQEW